MLVGRVPEHGESMDDGRVYCGYCDAFVKPVHLDSCIGFEAETGLDVPEDDDQMYEYLDRIDLIAEFGGLPEL